MSSASRPIIIACPTCLYELTDLPAAVARCPECGASTEHARSPLRLRNHRPWQTNIVALGALLIGLGTIFLAYTVLRACGVQLPSLWPARWGGSNKHWVSLELLRFLEPIFTLPALIMCLGAALMTVPLLLPKQLTSTGDGYDRAKEGRRFTFARAFCRLSLLAPIVLVITWYGQLAINAAPYPARSDFVQMLLSPPAAAISSSRSPPAQPLGSGVITAVSLGLLAPFPLVLLLDKRLDKPFRGWHAVRRLALLLLPLAAVLLYRWIRWIIPERLDRTSVPSFYYYGAVIAAIIFYTAAFTNLATSYLGLAWSLWRIRPRPAQTASVPAQTATTPAHISVPPPSDS